MELQRFPVFTAFFVSYLCHYYYYHYLLLLILLLLVVVVVVVVVIVVSVLLLFLLLLFCFLSLHATKYQNNFVTLNKEFAYRNIPCSFFE